MLHVACCIFFNVRFEKYTTVMLLKHASTYQYHAISKYVVQEPRANNIAPFIWYIIRSLISFS